jgi:peroxiredoxin
MSRREMSAANGTFWQCVDRFPQTEHADKSAHMIVGMHGAVGLWEAAHKQLEKLQKALPKPELIAELKRKLYAMENLQLGKPPIQFEVKDTDGRPLSLAALKGKCVLLVFWATWCPHCQAEVPYIVDAGKKFRDRGLVVAGVSLDKDLKTLQEYCQSNGVRWPNHFDGKGWQNELALKFDVTEVPQLFLIDKDGILRFRNTRRELIAERVEKLLRGDFEEVKEE